MMTANVCRVVCRATALGPDGQFACELEVATFHGPFNGDMEPHVSISTPGTEHRFVVRAADLAAAATAVLVASRRGE